MKVTIVETHDIKLTVNQIYQAIKELHKEERARLIEMILDGPDNGVTATKHQSIHARFYAGFNVAPGEFIAIDSGGWIHIWPSSQQPAIDSDGDWHSHGNTGHLLSKVEIGNGGMAGRNGVALHWRHSLYHVPLDG